MSSKQPLSPFVNSHNDTLVRRMIIKVRAMKLKFAIIEHQCNNSLLKEVNNREND